MASDDGVSASSAFYYDLGSPYAYLAAERITSAFEAAGAEQPEWQPILLGGLFGRFGRDSWAIGPGREEGMREVERRAQAYGLPPIRWPEPFPGNTLTAMRAATFAKQLGRAVSFSLAAFRQAFAAGRDLSEPDNVYIAAAASELHPRSLQTAIARDAIKAPPPRGHRCRRRPRRGRRPRSRRRHRGLLGRRSARARGRGGRPRWLSYVAVGWLRKR